MKITSTPIQTEDGLCTTQVFEPQGPGPWPGVIVYMDAFGIRPALVELASRIAQAGYLVLLPDLYYRFGPHSPFDPGEVLKGNFRATLGPLMSTTGPLQAAKDTASFLHFLDHHPAFNGASVGVAGFCMGGGMALTVAGQHPERIGASASFHGGNLLTDSPGSPHLAFPRIRGEVYIAGADRDASYPAEMAEKVEHALREAKVRHRCEIYPNCLHGWMMPDMPVHDPAGAERGLKALLELFSRNLHP